MNFVRKEELLLKIKRNPSKAAVPGPKGDTGAAGATGPQGPIGQTGPAGSIEDIIVANQQTLTFTNLVATINDTRITDNSLADVYFTSATIAAAIAAEIAVETFSGRMTLTATKTPVGAIAASIRVRVI